VAAEENNADCDLSRTVVTYGGARLTLAASAISGANGWRSCNGIFYLLNPLPGIRDVVIDFPTVSNGTIPSSQVGAFVVRDVAAAAPIVTATGGGSAGTNPVSLAVNAPVAGALAVDIVSQGDEGAFAATGINQVAHWQASCRGASAAGSTRPVAAAGVVSVGWTHSAPKRHAHSLVVFQPRS
jgi:hypothetical protein